MGQAVKYAALGAAIIVILALVVGVVSSVTGSEVSGGFTSSVTAFINGCSSILQNVKGALNYACGSGGAIALNLLIWLNVILPLAIIPVRLVIMLHRFINQ